MKQACREIGSACTRVGETAQTAGNFLAGLCLFFATAFAAFMPAPLENRIAYLFFLGLMPALVFYVSGHILRRMLGLSCKLCEIVAARFVRLLGRFAIGLANWPASSVVDVLDRWWIATDGCLLTT